MHKPFFFIGDTIVSNIDTPIKVINGYNIQKANSTQIKLIKQRLSAFQNAASDLLFYIEPYESEYIPDKNNSYRIIRLDDEKEWKYWVLEIDIPVEFADNKISKISEKIRLIDKAFLLSEESLQLLWGFYHYTVIENNAHVNRFSSYPYRPFNFYKRQFLNAGIIAKQISIDELTIKKIKLLISRIKKISKQNDYEVIQKVLTDFVNLFELPESSPFRIIGLFTILEYLLTSTNNYPERSINKQLQTKLNLLNNRSENKINVRNYFKVANEFTFEKVIEKLYTYRSDIAHGNKVDFEKKLQALNNHKKVHLFLMQLVKNILNQSLKEPDLILDLKKC